MRLQLAVEFSSESRESGGIYMSERWAIKAADRLRRMVANKQVSDKVLLEKRNLLEEQGPALWIMLCGSVKDKCLELNRTYGSVIVRVKDTELNRLDVRFELEGTSADLLISFEVTSADRALTWGYSIRDGKSPKGGFCPLFVDQNGRVGFMQAMLSRTPESLAEEMLNGLIAE
jgi:hypothetical protein